MEGFDHILNWRLLRGSHDFPGRDGGTCINEAAVVAAGFEYRAVTRIADLPSCFSRPICEFAMFLNDHASNDERQLLLPFVARLACADSEEVEQQRQTYISKRNSRFMSLQRGIDVLEGALSIGRQADPISLPALDARLSTAREKGRVAIPKPEKPVLTTLKKILERL